MNEGLLRFEGIVGYATRDAEEAAHFFEHTLGLELAAEDGGLRFYPLSDALTLAVDATGAGAGEPPYMLFSTTRLVEAGEHFLQRGCQYPRTSMGALRRGLHRPVPGGPHGLRRRRGLA